MVPGRKARNKSSISLAHAPDGILGPLGSLIQSVVPSVGHGYLWRLELTKPMYTHLSSLFPPPSLATFPPSLTLPLTPSLTELNEFIIQLDEEVEAMQSTILHLQHQLKETKTDPKEARTDLAVGFKESRTDAMVGFKEARTHSKPNGPLETQSTSDSSGKNASWSQE